VDRNADTTEYGVREAHLMDWRGWLIGSFTGWIIVPEIERWARGAFRGRGGGPGGYSVMASSNICFVRSPTGSCFLSMLMTMDVASGEACFTGGFRRRWRNNVFVGMWWLIEHSKVDKIHSVTGCD
jgi:hypothetical protein